MLGTASSPPSGDVRAPQSGRCRWPCRCASSCSSPTCVAGGGGVRASQPSPSSSEGAQMTKAPCQACPAPQKESV